MFTELYPAAIFMRISTIPRTTVAANVWYGCEKEGETEEKCCG